MIQKTVIINIIVHMFGRICKILLPVDVDTDVDADVADDVALI